MDVRPLGISQIDWRGYIDFMTEQVGRSPVHNLDVYHMTPDSIGAFMASLMDGRDPRQILRHEARVLNHIHLSFLICCEDELLSEIVTWDLDTLSYEAKRRKLVLILSGTIKQWKETALSVCTPGTVYEARVIMNKCVLYMEKAGLAEVFGNYKKEPLRDESFILKEKA